jgi:hypothetical protein
MILFGVIAGFLGHWWGQGWIWVALFALLGIWFWVYRYSRRHFATLRRAAGAT